MLIRDVMISYFKIIILSLFLNWFLSPIHFAQAAPGALTYYGEILKPDGTPLESASVQITVQIVSPGSESCKLLDETHTVNMEGANGQFALTLGSGTRTGSDPNIPISQIFKNAGSLTGLTCQSGTAYSPSPTDTRKILVSIKDGVETINFETPLVLNSVPFAFEAERLAGKTEQEFISVLNNNTQTRFNRIFSADYAILDHLLDGSSSLYLSASSLSSQFAPTASVNWNTQKITSLQDPSSAQDAATKNYSDSQIASKSADLTGIGAGVGDGKVLLWSAAGNSWVVGTPSVSASDNTKLPLSGGSMSGAVNMGLNSVTNTGYITMSASKYLQLSNLSTAQDTALVNSFSTSATPAPSSFAGASWYNTTTQNWRLWNGSAAETLVKTSSSQIAGGSISGTNVSASALVVDTNTLLVDSSNNRVGIGVASPNTGLDVAGALTQRGLSGGSIPPVSSASQGVIYFDSSANKFKVSENGGAYSDLVGGGGGGGGGGGSGTMTSVGLSLPSEWSVSGSPVSSASGTLSAAWAAQSGHKILASPVNGSSGAPAFRALAAADMPSAGGDISGSFSTLSVDKIKGVNVSIASLSNQNYLKYNGSNWVNTLISVSDISSGELPVARGGTALSSGTSGGIPYYSASGALASSAALTQNSIIYGGGAGAAPVASTAMTNGQLLVGKNSSAPQVVTMGGDASISNTGSVSVNLAGDTSKIFGANVSGNSLVTTNSTTGSAITAFAPPVAATSILSTTAGGAPTWSALSNVNMTQYAQLAGQAGGQSLSGGTAASESLTLDSTAHATKGQVLIAASGGGSVGVGTTTPSEILEVNGNAMLGASISTHATVDAGGVDATAITIPVNTTTGYPDQGIIIINSEAISYTGRTSNSFTGVTRHVLGSSAQSHNAGDEVLTYLMRGPSTGASGEPRFFINSNSVLSIGTPLYKVAPKATGSVSNAIMVGNNVSVGNNSIAVGDSAAATGDQSGAFGSNVTASGTNSFAANNGTTASGDNSTAHGEGTLAESFDSFALGRYNVGGGTAASWVSTDPLFEIGIGADSSNRANALTVLKNGKIGVLTAAPAAILDLSASTDAILLPQGNDDTTDRPTSPIAGMIRFNTTSSKNIVEVYTGSSWESIMGLGGGASLSMNGSGSIGLAASGSNQDVTLTASGTGVVTSGSPVTLTAGTASSSSSTGTLVVSGGAGIGGSINSGGYITSSGQMTATSSMIAPTYYGATSDSANLTVDSTSSVAVKGNVLIAPQGGNVGVGKSTSIGATLTVGDGSSTDSTIMARSYGVVGTDGQTLSVSGPGTRMFWYSKKAAFRTGGIDTVNPSDASGAYWNDSNIGNYSTALGLGNRAYQVSGFSAGRYINNTANYGIGMGNGAAASADRSVAIGNYSNASATDSVIFGKGGTYGTSALGFNSSDPVHNGISGNSSIVIGHKVRTGTGYAGTGGNYSMALGLGNGSGGTNLPAVSGTSSFGIFMGSQPDVVISASNVMTLIGGSLGIGTTSPGESLEISGGNLKVGQAGVANPNGALAAANIAGGGINTTDTTLTVDSTSNFPSTGTIQISNEIITYTGKTSTTLTGLTRGVYGTAAASHASGPVAVIMLDAKVSSSKSLARMYSTGGLAIGNNTTIDTGSTTWGGAQWAIGDNVSTQCWSCASVGGSTNSVTTKSYGANIGGYNNSITASFSSSIGSLDLSENRYGVLAHASGRFATRGDAKSVDIYLRAITSDATTTTLLRDGSTSSYVASVDNNSTLNCQISINARTSGGSTIASFERRALINRGANAAATTLVNTQTIGTDYNPGTWGGVALSADTTNGGLAIQVTGAAATTIRWLAIAKCAQIGY